MNRYFVIRTSGPLGTRYYAGHGSWRNTPQHARKYESSHQADIQAKLMNLPVSYRVATVIEEPETEEKEDA